MVLGICEGGASSQQRGRAGVALAGFSYVVVYIVGLPNLKMTIIPWPTPGAVHANAGQFTLVQGFTMHMTTYKAPPSQL